MAVQFCLLMSQFCLTYHPLDRFAFDLNMLQRHWIKRVTWLSSIFLLSVSTKKWMATWLLQRLFYCFFNFIINLQKGWVLNKTKYCLAFYERNNPAYLCRQLQTWPNINVISDTFYTLCCYFPLQGILDLQIWKKKKPLILFKVLCRECC